MQATEDQLGAALDALRGHTRFDLDAYVATPVSGGFQSAVWSLTPRPGNGAGALAVRLTPKPAELITRIGRIVDAVTAVPCARTLAATPIGDGRTAHLATWLPETAPATQVDMGALGTALAAVHRQLTAQPEPLLDRPLTFDLTDGPDPWSRARQHWVRGDRAWPQINGPQASWQPIHGDAHNGNYLITTGGSIGLIDFDKMMRAAPVFDLARIIDSALFHVSGGQAEFDTLGAGALLRAYYAPEPTPEDAVTAVEGFTILLNEATGTLSRIGASPQRAARAGAIGRWWLQRADYSDPMGLRATLHPQV